MKIVLSIILCAVVAFGVRAQDEVPDKGAELYNAVDADDQALVESLLKDGADASYVKEMGGMKLSVLILAINHKHIGILKLLLRHKADVHFKDGFQMSAIIYAAETGMVDMVKLLLEHGANIDDDDGNGNTVLSAAKDSKNPEMIKFVKQTAKR